MATVAGGLGIATLLGGCSGTPPKDLGVQNNRLTACPDKPNCVNSFANPDEDSHFIEALSPAPADATWTLLQTIIEAEDSATIVERSPGYLRAEYRSALFGFTDDVEFMLDEAADSIQVRSASRLGYGDLGVNRARIETIRQQLTEG